MKNFNLLTSSFPDSLTLLKAAVRDAKFKEDAALSIQRIARGKVARDFVGAKRLQRTLTQWSAPQ